MRQIRAANFDANEFALIDAITRGLIGQQANGLPWDQETMPQSFPLHQIYTDRLHRHTAARRALSCRAPPELIGYRALTVSFSDLAAMRGMPKYCLVSLSIDESQLALGADWVLLLARGMADAAQELGIYVCGGNLTRGPLNIAVSVHGEVAPQQILRRSGGYPVKD